MLKKGKIVIKVCYTNVSALEELGWSRKLPKVLGAEQNQLKRFILSIRGDFLN